MNENFAQVLSPEARAAFKHFGRLGGLKSAATRDVFTTTAHARRAKADKWLYGHGCVACGDYIAIPADLTDAERARRAGALRKRHYVQLGHRGGKR